MMVWVVKRTDAVDAGECEAITCCADSEQQAFEFFPDSPDFEVLEARLVAHGSTSSDPEVLMTAFAR